MTRISIVGNSASGKSTLSRRLGAHYGIEVRTIDKIYWLENWPLRDQASFHALHSHWLNSASWIIDGVGYWAELEVRLRCSDRIIFLDVPPSRCKDQALARIEAEKSVPNDDITAGCRYGDVEALQMQVIDAFHRDTRPDLLKLISGFSVDKVQILQSAEQLRIEP